jgi:hypothetical protein
LLHLDRTKIIIDSIHPRNHLRPNTDPYRHG